MINSIPAIADACGLGVIALAALMMWRTKRQLSRRIAILLALVGADVGMALISRFLDSSSLPFIVIVTMGRWAEIMGIITFILWLIEGPTTEGK